MSYQRLEVNLLPPELAPPPAVRVAPLLNVVMVLFAIAYIGVDLSMHLGKIAELQKQKKEVSDKINLQKPHLDEYNALAEIASNTEGRGKLVGMASAGYVEYPVVLERVSHLLPDGVYLVQVSSTGSVGGRGSSDVLMKFRASRNDPVLLSQTLEAFKGSPVFTDAFIRNADFTRQPLQEISAKFGIPYSYTPPAGEETQEFVADTYDFEISAHVNSPLDIYDMPAVMDNSDLMTQFTLDTDPSAAVPAGAPPATPPGGAAPASPPPAGAAPGEQPAGGTPPAGGAH